MRKKLSLGLIAGLCFTTLSYAHEQPAEQDVEKLRTYITRYYIPAMDNYRTPNSAFNLNGLETMLRGTPGMRETSGGDGHRHFRHMWSGFRFEIKNRGGEKTPKSSMWKSTFEHIQEFIDSWNKKF
jgi:hypothetical protein